ncbi:uncharacterized protein DUF4153 [Maribacter vaceletii]|uniref:Uncharacterized protein DUF4153 n=1 Tax=Maribacter vaceletii TaxID=1206816 RepID=A0A495ECZ4_9FLAO|nr:DUF4153 domain-containing protein [Maribacter vaceletii]RKR14676.1 uncharacterized protein DUF4153 [Maribacter vaceletii]
MKIPSLVEITAKAESAAKRFPITIIWSILGTLYCIGLLEDTGELFEDKENVLLTLSLGISWLIGTQFLIEQFKNKNKWQWLKLLVLALLGLFYWYYPSAYHYDQNPIYLTRFFLYIIAGHLFVFFAPFIVKWNKNAYWNYLNLTGTAITRSLFFSGILYLGLVLALVAIEALFDVTIKGRRYGQLFIFCLGIINTWIYLADFPKNILKNTEIHFNKPIEVLVKYILIPLVIIYLLILYAYSGKIVLEWKLPKGWVSYLVIALSILGYIIQIIINPVQKNIKSWTINRFFPWFYIVLIPLNILLFVAIFRRINDYGITENRYFVLAIALWNVAMIIYLLFSKNKALKVIPISLFAIAILSSFGFWGAYSVSNRSQTKRFEKIFTAVKEKNNTATGSQLSQLKSILKFLEEHKKVTNLNTITQLNLEDYREKPVDSLQPGYLNKNKIWEKLDIKVDPTTITDKQKNDVYYSRHQYNNYKFSESVSAYDYFTYLKYFNTSKTIDAGEYEIALDMDTIQMSISSKKDATNKIEIPLREKLVSLSAGDPDLRNLDDDNFTIELKTKTLDIKMHLSELNYRVKYDKSIVINNFSAFIFIKEN